ncbi:MBL fold metallo-hydrolase [Conexibacter sp. JD483]|uniref:MBL fold metallo-hydrolase n=1 Tax=unclassified Conexibacter TaxID=2627773 RepID=UPI002726EC75|nr:MULTISPECIES: MBL fold metallo-hydrolase [unclassified Conexibacter]MDO8186594.1 MBL fold metallo-hydrolase [Conexibacter sp. CPCC 205706]MDO8196699.1 MBL fold metallo-hydrolase [Conexibacter sp. CPCC 205762]MDR9371810.1 MBL fold metallo-hydrolase [Conexibacter sp. JD483]
MRRITWLGHATVLIETDSGARLLTDPLLRGRVAHLRRHAPAPPDAAALGALDAVLVSHVHHDHLDRPSLRTLAARETEVVLPLGGRKLVGGLGFGAVREVGSGVRLRAGAAEVEVVPAWHPTRRWPRSPQLDALGYLVEGIWFAGDTDLDERMGELRGRVEVALVPIWGWGPSLGPGHLDPSGAARAVALVRPRVAIPIHWGTYLPYGLARRHGGLLTSPAGDFATAVARVAPGTRVETLAPGASFELP